MRVPILTYHKVDTRFEFGITRVSPREFEKHIKFFNEQGYKAITVTEARNLKTNEDKFICITFDDGYEDIFYYAFPILKRYGFRATVFVISNFVGRTNNWDFGFGIRFKHLNWEQIKILFDNGWEIGSHSANHRALTFLDDEEVKFEVESSKYEIEKNLGAVVKSFAPPFSRYDENIARIVFGCGYEGIYALTNGEKIDGVYHRFAVYTIDSIASLKRKIEGAKFEKIKLNLINSFSEFTILINYAKNKIFNK